VLIDRFVFAIPPATSPSITLHASHVPPSSLVRQRAVDLLLCRELTPSTRCLHKITMSSAVQFPELRLIQYDCGALIIVKLLLLLSMFTAAGGLTVTSKIQIGFTFLVPSHMGSPGQRAVKWVCACVCVCLCVYTVVEGKVIVFGCCDKWTYFMFARQRFLVTIEH